MGLAMALATRLDDGLATRLDVLCTRRDHDPDAPAMFRAPHRLLRPRLALGLRPAPPARRRLHHLPLLPHDYSDGVPNLMSAAGFAIAWTNYMGLMVEKLNAMTAGACSSSLPLSPLLPLPANPPPPPPGTELEEKDAKTVALLTAREPSQAPIFNYASMAHNTHFFFQGIAPAPTAVPDVLRRELEASFSSMATLRREFVLTASAMFGPGFVWLVKAGPGDYRLLPTYLAGSPYPGAHWRAQADDMNALGADASARPFFRNTAAALRRRNSDLPPGGIELEPLLCLSTWEHSWLLDWGVGVGGSGGKMAFAEAWWDAIDWDRVAQRSDVLRPDFKSAAPAQ